jgi:hypothetical protein
MARIAWRPIVKAPPDGPLICVNQCLSAEEGQSEEAFMRALPQSVPVKCGTEVGRLVAAREHRRDHFDKRLEILCLAARSPEPGK